MLLTAWLVGLFLSVVAAGVVAVIIGAAAAIVADVVFSAAIAPCALFPAAFPAAAVS